ncbi:hypothetical protein GUJ93_ZPchr0005g16271 [Zizania palustris]|uniref:Uncharacterized protein n=1 Tax=Zizania palustris TaxID=103762 RepID=A0A8J5W0U7_ZIZPA|nr:hypothetical protein GUJ93_ZPchr0005g16271 [Zizania palustris]
MAKSPSLPSVPTTHCRCSLPGIRPSVVVPCSLVAAHRPGVDAPCSPRPWCSQSSPMALALVTSRRRLAMCSACRCYHCRSLAVPQASVLPVPATPVGGHPALTCDCVLHPSANLRHLHCYRQSQSVP